MARLIIVAGASGAGKSFLLEQLQRLEEGIKPIKKLTTRPPRENETSDSSLDLMFNCTDAQIRRCDYSYNYCEHNYGIKKADIDRVLLSGLSPIVIVARCSAIAQIKEDYKSALVLYVQNVLSGVDLQKVLIKRGDTIGVDERIRRQRASLHEYVSNIDKKLFDYVLINDFTDVLMEQVQYVLNNERKKDVDNNYVFVIMSFQTEYDEIYKAYQNASKIVHRKGIIQVQRVDDNRGGYVITEKIASSIERAGLILCDVSKTSPNVYLELGYALQAKKDMIITAQTGTKLPFDIRNYRTVFYNTAMDLQEKMVFELKNYYHV